MLRLRWRFFAAQVLRWPTGSITRSSDGPCAMYSARLARGCQTRGAKVLTRFGKLRVASHRLPGAWQEPSLTCRTVSTSAKASVATCVTSRPGCRADYAEGRRGGSRCGFLPRERLHASSLLKSFDSFRASRRWPDIVSGCSLDPRLLCQILSLAFNLATDARHSSMERASVLSIARRPPAMTGRSGVMGTELFQRSLCRLVPVKRRGRFWRIICGRRRRRAAAAVLRPSVVLVKVGEMRQGGLEWSDPFPPRDCLPRLAFSPRCPADSSDLWAAEK